MAEDDYQDNQQGMNESIRNTVNRFEEMIKNRDRYFFDVDPLLKIIDYYMETGESAKALEVSNYAVSIHPNTSEFQLKKAQILAGTGKEKDALDILLHIEKLLPYEIDIPLLRGSIYNSLGKYEQALSSLKAAITMVEQKDELYLNIGLTYENMQDYSSAVEYFKLAIRANPDFELAMSELTISYSADGKLHQAAEYYRELIDEDPYSHLAWYNLGDVYCRLGEYEESLKALDYCVIIKEDFLPAILDQAHVLALTGRYREAVTKYKHTFEHFKPDAVTYFNLAECYEKLEEMEEARIYYKKSVKLLPQLAHAWFGIAITLEYEERWYEAIHYVKKALEKDPDNSEYRLLLSDCEYNLNNFAEAEDGYNRVISDEPDLTEGWIALAQFLADSGRYEEAIDITQKGLILHPDSRELQFRQVANQYLAGYVKESYNLLSMTAAEADDMEILFDMMPQLRFDKTVMGIIKEKNLNR